KAFNGAFAGVEGTVILVHIAGDKVSRVSVSTGYQYRRNIHHVRGKPGSYEFGDSLARGNQNLAAHVATFFYGCELILEMNARRTSRYHSLHEFKGVQYTSEAGFRIGHDRCKVT